MDVNNSSQALLNPGEADDFFEIKGLQNFNLKETEGFDRMNALWLSEFSRLIYRQEKDEIPTRSQDFRTRSSFLANKGWEEDTFFNKQSGVFLNAQASIFSNNDLKVAVLVFRGTLGLADMIIDVLFKPKDWAGTGKVHEGFSEALELAWGSIKEGLAELRFPVFFTGHSLGAALATLAVGRCLHDQSPLRPAALYTFGSPRVGDARFADALQGVSHCRVVDQSDIILKVPPEINLPPFVHAGNLHHIPDGDDLQSPFLQNIDGLVKLSTKLQEVCEGRIDPPKFLADHAPVNYTARLEKE